ncbi:cell adhesion molecule DSCAML1-like isoform 2-T2 [Spinachia spinachia]
MTFQGRPHLCFKLLFGLLVGCVSAEHIIATVGEDVTLICNYDAKKHGKLSACWGRGAVPNSGCANEVIRSDGTAVISRLSERYNLRGDVGVGEVSLTIRQVEEADSGMYGCRVEIPGWFNDHKHQLTLTVVAVRPNALKVETREVKEKTVTVCWTAVFDGGKPITAYRIDLKNKQASWDTAVSTTVSNPQLTQLTLADLRPAKHYNLRMFAINIVGMSEASNVLTVTTKEAAPESPPLDMQLKGLTARSIQVTWKPPRLDHRNGVLRSYSVSYREYDATGRHFKRWQHLSVPATRELESVVLTNLRPSAAYGVIVQAKTNAGVGPASTAPLCSTLDESSIFKSSSSAATIGMQETSGHITSTTETVTAATGGRESTSSELPDPPVIHLTEVKDNTISISWIPGFEGDSAITGYYLECKAVNASWDNTKMVIDFSPNQTEATIIEIYPSTYSLRMFTKNSLGTSKGSNILTITTGEAGHQRVDLVTTVSTDTHAAASVKESKSGHLAAIVVPLVLVVTAVAIVAMWQLQRIKLKKGTVSMWLTNEALRHRGAESLQEL